MLYVPRAFYLGKNGFKISIFSGQTGDFVSVDRIAVSESPVFDDVNGSVGVNKFVFTDASFGVAANSTSQRNFTAAGVKAVKGNRVSVSTPDLPAGLGMQAFSYVDNQVSLLFTNHTAGSITMPASTYNFETS
jgi:hypothetical protein